MRHLLGSLLALTLLLGGCGDGDVSEIDGVAEDDGTPTAGSKPTPGPLDFTEVAIVSESAVGGAVSPKATVLDSDAAVADFSAQFTDERMAERLESEVASADVPDGESLLGAVVAISCEAPEEIFVEYTERGVAITAGKIDTGMQCLVPVTSVALVTVDSSAV